MEWTKKIVAYQADPPSHAWNEIEKALEQDENSLHNHAVMPPNDSWEAISARLSSTADVPSDRVRSWLRPVFRYAAIILFMAFATTTLISSSFRNALMESIQGPGMKAALSDTQQLIKKDTSKNRLQEKQIQR